MAGTLYLLLLLTALTAPGYTARILGVAPFPAPSHQILLTSLFKELANRGHHLTVITPLPLKENKPTNYVEIQTGITMKDIFAQEHVHRSPLSDALLNRLSGAFDRLAARESIHAQPKTKNEVRRGRTKLQFLRYDCLEQSTCCQVLLFLSCLFFLPTPSIPCPFSV
uniref:Uncharacterized protein n=1 Tax=Timema douglasi TaxID=61478 RepID=A0A7R8VSW4_TIMDO|nr:unnamed protein product [Timema douglasi]